MFNRPPFRRSFISQALGISVLITVLIAVGCGSGNGSGGATGGGAGSESPSLEAIVLGTGNFSSGEQGATYAITVSNIGTASTSGTVTVADPPTGFTVTAIRGGISWNCTLSTTTCTYSNSVGAGQSFPAITVTGNVTSANGTPVTIPVNLSGGGAKAVTVTPTPSVAVAPVALDIKKTHTGNFTPGQIGATYRLTVSNGAGAGTTSEAVTVTEMPPPGLTVTAMAGGPGSSWACVVATLSCTRSDALTGESSYDTIYVTVNVAANAGSPLANQAKVSGGNQTTAVTPASDSTTIVMPPALQISKSHTGSFFQGQVGATYTVTVNNAAGAGPTRGAVFVTELPPSGLTVTAMAGGTGSSWECFVATLTCTRSDALAGGSSYDPITVTASVNATAASPQVNRASVSGGGAAIVSTNDSATIIPAPVLRIVKTHTGSFVVGQQDATYMVTVSNLPGQLPTSGPVTVTEMPPPGLTVTGMSGGTGSSWVCVVATLSCTRSDALAGGASYDPITVTVNVEANVTSPEVNTVTVSGGGSENNSTTDSATVIGVTCSSLSLLGSESLLSGTHIAILSGWKDGGGPTQAVAAFAVDSAGGVISGEMDSGTVVVDDASQSAPALSTISSGCYQLGSDNLGLMIWNFAGGKSVIFAISISPNDQGGASDFLIEFDDANPGTSPGTRLAGRMYFQTPGPYTLASFSGPLAFFTTGYSPNSGNTDYLRTGTVGRLDDSATGAVTNGALNVGLTTARGTQANFDNQNFTGTFGPPDALGRGILTLNFTRFGTLGATTFNFAYYIDDVNDLYLQSIDTPDTAGHSLQNGDVVTQLLSSFTPAAFNGNASIFMIGADIGQLHSYTVTIVGQVTGDGLGGSTARLDEVSDGSVVATGTNLISGGSFAVSSNGMGVLTVGSGASAQSFSTAMFNQNGGYLLEGTAASPGSHILTGAFRQHMNSGGVFDNGTFSGAYIFGPHKQGSTNSVFGVGSVMTPTPQTNPTSFSGKTDESSAAGCNTGCLSVDHAVSATYSVDANGRITILPGLTGGTSVGWFENNGNTLVLISDTSDANGTILNMNN